MATGITDGWTNRVGSKTQVGILTNNNSLIYLVKLILIGEVNLNIGDNSVNSDPEG
jgi:hypothetical protein